MKIKLSAIVATTIMLGSFSLANPARGLAADAPAPTENQGTESVDNRIKELHDKLKITQSQEDLWNKVAQEMRDSAKSVHALAGTRTQKASTMTAIDDLKSYAEIAKNHAEGMVRFVDVFSPLYSNMSDDQKKNADEVFRGHKEARAKKHQTALKQ